MDPTETRPDSDITLGEVNRNVIRVEGALKDTVKQFATRAEHVALAERVRNLETNSATKDDVSDLRGLIQEIKENLKSKGGTYLTLAGIIVPSVIAVWAVVRG